MSFSNRFDRLATALLGLALFAAACGGGTPSSGPVASGSAQSGGSMTFATGNSPRGLDAGMLGNSGIGGGLIGNAVYDQLLWIDPLSGEVHYVLATGLKSTDGQHWTVSLRPNVKFSDGTPFNAAAVQFSWTRLTDPQLGSDARQTAQQISNVTTPDDLTVNFDLQQKNSQFPQLVNSLGGLNWIVSPTAVKNEGDTFANQPVGAGPFVVKDFIRNSKIDLARNPGYWQKDLPKVDALTFVINTNLQNHYDMVATGQAQGYLTTAQTNIAQAKTAGLNITTYPLQGGIDLVFNTQKPPFDDPRARHAVVEAFDPKYFNDTVNAGQEIIADTIFTEGSPYYDAAAIQPHDNATAQQLLDQLAADGKPLSFTFLSNPTTFSAGAAEALTAVFGQLQNVTVNVKSLDLATYGSSLQKGDFDAALGGSMGTDPDLAFYNAFTPQGAANFGRWNNTVAAKALQDGRDAADQGARKAAYETFQKQLLADAPVEFLIRSNAVMVTRPNVAGIQLYAVGSPILTGAYYTGGQS